VPQIRTTVGPPAAGFGNNGDYAIDEAAKLIYGPKAAGAWPAGVSLGGDKGDKGDTGATGATGATGNSLNRPTTTLTSAAGVATIDLSQPYEVYLFTLTENVTSWVFSNRPAAGKTAEIRVVVIQAAGGTQYACASPATGKTAGGAWVNSMTAGATEWLGLAIDSTGVKGMVASGVLV
jgi:hypothetical protein